MTILPKLEDLTDPTFNAFEMERMSTGRCPDPYPRIHELMQQGSVVEGCYREQFTDIRDHQHSGLPQKMVLGYDAVLHVLTHPEIFTNREAFLPSLGVSFGESVSVMDAPDHTRYRRIFQKAFLPQVVSKWGETVVDPVVHGLMDAFVGTGKADLIEQFTHYYPFQVIYAQLELEPEQGPIFHKLAIAQLLSSIGAPQGREASTKLGSFFTELLEQRRAKPGNDLVSHLATVESDGERLPDIVLISFLRQLMNAGGDTTFRGTSALLTGLLSNTDQLDAVRADRSLIAQAIDEALRWEGPVTSTLRYAIQDTEINGITIPKGTFINLVLASANRDPSKFENPDKFDIFRDRKHRSLAFASGPHLCIGQHLAKVEMTRALNALLDNLPNLRLDPDMPPPQMIGHILRSPEHVYVRFDN